MTLPEIHTQIRVKFEAIAAQTLDNFLPQEIDLYLNEAIREFIGQHRPLIIQMQETPQTREGLENLRTLLESYSYPSADFTDEAALNGGWSVPIADLSPDYEYFISGRLSTDKDVYNVETTTIRDFYEHLETRHNIPHFRRAKIVERGSDFLLALPDPDETPETLQVTYLGEFVSVDIKLAVEYIVSSNTGSNTASIDIQGIGYDIPYNSNAQTTVDDFISNHKSDIASRHDIVAEDYGDTIRLTTFNEDLVESDFGYTASSADVSLSQSTVTTRTEISLPTTTHQELVDLTANLMRQDLPQAQADRQQQQQ